MFPNGKTVIGRITNTAVSSVTAIAFVDVNGGTHTFLAGERLIVKVITVNNRATAKDLTIFQDTDAGADVDAGEELQVISFAAAGFSTVNYDDGLPAQRINAAATNTFKAFASAAGAVDILVLGEVVKS